jgi:hypothetical protein
VPVRRAATGVCLMPKIPIIPPREYGGPTGDPGGRLGENPEPLSPEMQDGLKAVEDRTARIDREVAVSQAWRAGVERLAEAEETPGGAPVGFTRSFLDDLDRKRQQLLKTLPPSAQEPLERDLLDLRADFLDRAAQTEASGMALRRRTGLYDALDGYASGVTRDPGLFDRAVGRMDSLISGLALPEDRQGPMRTYVRTVLASAAVDRLMEDPARAERVLSDGLYDDVLPAPVKALRLKEAQDKVARNNHLNRERAVADLAAQAQDGTASDEVILEAERGQTLSPADGAYLWQANAKATEAATFRDARIRRVTTATERLEPSNAEDRAAASEYWDSVAEVYRSDDPRAQQENERRFIERTGVLPKALENKYRGALLSKEPAVVVQGATAIARLASQNSALVDGIPAEEVRRAQAIYDYASLDIAPDRAVELGDEKAAAESIQSAGSTRPGEVQVAVDDEPPVMSDATDRVASAEGPGSDATRVQLVQAPAVRKQPPNWDEIDDLGRLLQSDGEDTFVAAARKAGLDPDRVRLFIDMLNARPAERDAILERIETLYGRLGAAFLKAQFERFVGVEDRDLRKRSVDDRRKDLLADAPERETLGEQAFDVTREIIGVPGGRSRPGRSPDQSSRSPKQPGNLKPGPGYRLDRKFITPEEYTKLPEIGRIDPQRIRTSQDSFSNKFKEEDVAGRGLIRRTVDELAADARAGNDEDVPPIRLVEWKGHVYSPDHRRLVAYRRAGKDIQYVKINLSQLDKNAKKRIHAAANINDNGSFIRDRDANLME